MPCRSQFQSEKSIRLCHPRGDEKSQLIKRLPAPIIRHLLASHRNDQLSARAAARELGLSRPRFYKLYSQYLRACAAGPAAAWSPGVSGGDHQPAWSAEVLALLNKLLASQPPSSYSACASELHRRLNFETDRARVRRWAIENRLAPDTRYKVAPKPVKRWQARDLGALWQYDASPANKRCSIFWTTPPVTIPAHASTQGKPSWPILISWPAFSKPTACP